MSQGDKVHTYAHDFGSSYTHSICEIELVFMWRNQIFISSDIEKKILLKVSFMEIVAMQY